jgi:glycosyltransferase involved in cell wall biosynthesis
MVTADRRALCRRSIRCFQRQTYPNRELVVVDDGEEDLGPVLSDVPARQVRYVKLEKKPENVLGRLRNIALEHASGTFLAQWDDDDWYHAERLEKQVATLQQGYDACSLYGALMHIDAPTYVRHPYIGYLGDGVPGSIVHRRDAAIRYPEMRRAEDTVYLNAWLEKRYTMLPGQEAHLFIRCFHGDNTWEKKHFLTRMRNTVPDALAYVWYRFVRNDLFQHPRFQLSDAAWAAFETYLQDSRELGLIDHSVEAYA